MRFVDEKDAESGEDGGDADAEVCLLERVSREKVKSTENTR